MGMHGVSWVEIGFWVLGFISVAALEFWWWMTR